MDKATVSVHFVAAALARLSAAQRGRVLAAAGIAPELLSQPRARVPAQAFSALWLAVAEAIDDEFFGLDRRRMKVGSFALLSRAVLAAGDLGRALRLILRGFGVFLDDVAGELVVERGTAVVRVANRIADADARRFADETFLVMVHGLACWLVGRRIPLKSAEFAHPRPGHAAEYTLMFSDTLRFDAPATAIRFDAQLLAAPVVQTPGTLKVFLRTAPQSVFLKYRNDHSWTARLRRRLRGCIGGHEAWPGFDDLAREFHVAPTTLRRRLDAEGTSYQQIKDRLRLDLAINQLCSSDVPAAQIAVRLGFSDPSTFYRAFKRWSGVQPGEYRARRSVGTGAVAGAP